MEYFLYNIKKNDSLPTFMKFIFDGSICTVSQFGNTTDTFLYIILVRNDRTIAVALEVDYDSKGENPITYDKYKINAAELFDNGDPVMIEVTTLEDLARHIWAL